MLRLFIFTSIFCPSLVAAPVPKNRGEQPLDEQLLGAWTVQSREDNGMMNPPETTTWTFKQTEMISNRSGSDSPFPLVVRVNQQPAEFDLGTQLFTAIFEISGDTLRVCYSSSPNRPKAFDSKQGTLVVLKRQEKP